LRIAGLGFYNFSIPVSCNFYSFCCFCFFFFGMCALVPNLKVRDHACHHRSISITITVLSSSSQTGFGAPEKRRARLTRCSFLRAHGTFESAEVARQSVQGQHSGVGAWACFFFIMRYMFIYIYSRLITVEFLAVCGVHGIISHSQFSCLFFFKPVFYICLSRTYFPCMRAVQSYCLMNPLLYILKIGKYCMALEELDLSTNRFTGPLPVTFDDLPALQVLRLMNNALTGARLFFLCCCSIFRFL